MRRLLTIACLVAACPGYASSHAGALPGEAFTFNFSVGPVESGRARMSVGVPAWKNGRRLIAVHGQAETARWLSLMARLDDDYQLVLDAATLLPREVVAVEHGIRERRIAATVDGCAVDVELTSKQKSGRARKLLPEVPRDPLSALFALRAAPLADGDQLGLIILDGLTQWRTTMTVHRGVTVRLADGVAPPRAAIRIDGDNQPADERGKPTSAPPRHFTVWLSDDNDRALLRLEATTDLGPVSIELTSYHGPRTRGASPSLPGLTIRR